MCDSVKQSIDRIVIWYVVGVAFLCLLLTIQGCHRFTYTGPGVDAGSVDGSGGSNDTHDTDNTGAIDGSVCVAGYCVSAGYEQSALVKVCISGMGHTVCFDPRSQE